MQDEHFGIFPEKDTLGYSRIKDTNFLDKL